MQLRPDSSLGGKSRGCQYNNSNVIAQPIEPASVPKKNKVVHLTSVHDPFDVRVFHKECKTFAEAGYEVVLVAPHKQDELLNGVRIRAVDEPNSRFERMIRTVWQVFRAAVDEDAFLYHFHDPELIPVGLLLKCYGRRVIYDAHENVSQDILNKDYIPPVLNKLTAALVSRFEYSASLLFDRIVAATPSIAKRFSQQKTLTVQNFPIRNGIQPIAVSYCQRPIVAAYVGEITAARGIKEMVAAMGLLPSNVDARLILAAKFRPSVLEHEVKQIPGWERVDFVGWLPSNEVAALLGQARMGLVLFHPLPNHLDAQPHKLFDYMSAGIPVIASDFPLWRKIIQETGCGILVDPLNPKAIAEAILWLLEHPEEAETMGRRASEAASSRFNWGIEAAKLVGLYQELLPTTA